jgi:aminoglycoside phosphotransferase (APT) family kinase protein
VLDDIGWDSRVYLVDGAKAVFKFPREPHVATQYHREIAMLLLTEGIDAPVTTPRVQWEHPDNAWFGYAGVPGRPLTDVLDDAGADEERRIGDALGGFIRQLQHRDLDGLPRRTLDDELALYERRRAQAAPVLDRELSDGERRRVDRFFVEELPAALHALGAQLVLSHADLGPWNVLVDASGAIGIIDFGDACYADAAADFGFPWAPALLEAAYDAYGADDLLREKAALRQTAFPVLDLPYYIGKADPEGIQGCLAMLRGSLLA